MRRGVTRISCVECAGKCIRWRIEGDYEELKQELDLRQFEGPELAGFYRHATPSITAYGFLVVERCLFCHIPISVPAPRSRGAACTNRARHNPYSIATLRHEIANSSAPDVRASFEVRTEFGTAPHIIEGIDLPDDRAAMFEIRTIFR
jgi:hypothetical protein